jgi:hypothetical protein
MVQFESGRFPGGLAERRGLLLFRGDMGTDQGGSGEVKKVRRTKRAAKAKKATVPRTIKPERLVEKAIRGIANRIESDDMKATIGDLIRLLQLRQELETEQPKEIKVTWVERDQKPVSEE